MIFSTTALPPVWYGSIITWTGTKFNGYPSCLSPFSIFFTRRIQSLTSGSGGGNVKGCPLRTMIVCREDMGISWSNVPDKGKKSHGQTQSWPLVNQSMKSREQNTAKSSQSYVHNSDERVFLVGSERPGMRRVLHLLPSNQRQTRAASPCTSRFPLNIPIKGRRVMTGPLLYACRSNASPPLPH